MFTSGSRETSVTAAFIDIADTMVADYDVNELAYRVCDHCVKLIDVDAAGLLLDDGRGSLGLLASSNEQARLIELFQLQASGGGPCVECFRTARPVAAVNLPQHRQAWPGFTTEALRQGYHTVYALPMLLRAETIGTLNLFRKNRAPLASSDLALAQALADITTIAVLQERLVAQRELVVEQLQGALNSRVMIEQAKGVLSNLGRIRIDEAFRVLRAFARTHNLLLTELARAVTEDRDRALQVLEFAERR